MLKNAYLDAKIGVDPAENEPSKVSAPNLSLVRQYTESPSPRNLLRRARGGTRRGDRRHRSGAALETPVRPRGSSTAIFLSKSSNFSYWWPCALVDSPGPPGRPLLVLSI